MEPDRPAGATIANCEWFEGKIQRDSLGYTLMRLNPGVGNAKV